MFEFLLLCGNSLITNYMNPNCKETNYLDISSDYAYYDNVINFSPELQGNLDIIDSFEKLEYNWNGYGGLKLSKSVIDNARSALYFLDRQPDIFPTGRNSIQFEYERENGDYLEFEIFENSIVAFQIVADEETECGVNEKEMEKMVIEFYA